MCALSEKAKHKNELVRPLCWENNPFSNFLLLCFHNTHVFYLCEVLYHLPSRLWMSPKCSDPVQFWHHLAGYPWRGSILSHRLSTYAQDSLQMPAPGGFLWFGPPVVNQRFPQSSLQVWLMGLSHSQNSRRQVEVMASFWNVISSKKLHVLIFLEALPDSFFEVEIILHGLDESVDTVLKCKWKGL